MSQINNQTELINTCKCDDAFCAKCLSINCQDKNCSMHTKENKMAWRKRWELANHKIFPSPENY